MDILDYTEREALPLRQAMAAADLAAQLKADQAQTRLVIENADTHSDSNIHSLNNNITNSVDDEDLMIKHSNASDILDQIPPEYMYPERKIKQDLINLDIDSTVSLQIQSP
jgi:hypothetical protein